METEGKAYTVIAGTLADTWQPVRSVTVTEKLAGAGVEELLVNGPVKVELAVGLITEPEGDQAYEYGGCKPETELASWTFSPEHRQG